MTRINYDLVKDNIKDQLASTSGGLFDFDSMSNHIKYEQNENGTVVIENNEPVITKQYDVPAFDLMLSAYSANLIGAFHTSGTFEDMSDVVYDDLKQFDILVYDGETWSNTSLSAAISGDVNNDLIKYYIPKSDGIGGWNQSYLYEDYNGLFKLRYGTGINKFSNDSTLSGNSSTTVSSEYANKTYMDNLVETSAFWTVVTSGISPAISGNYVGIGNAFPINTPTATLHVWDVTTPTNHIAFFRNSSINAVVDMSIVNDVQGWGFRVDGLNNDVFHIRDFQNSKNVLSFIKSTGYSVFSGCIKSTTGDPISAEGMLQINTSDNKIRIYADGAWRDLATW